MRPLSMPSRRSHTKSRKGCLECKRRHVKAAWQRESNACDEGTPKCTLCKKRRLECSYPPPQSDLDSSHGSPSGQDGSESGHRTPGGDQSMQTRMLEMRLFHQYLTSTCHTLSLHGLSAYHLSIIIPQMATSFPYLLDSILALSALHLATVEANNRLAWLDAAVRYQSQACSGMGKILPDVTPEHYESAFVSSVFIFLFATGFPGISPESNQNSNPISEVLEGRRLITGAAMLFERFNEIGVDAKLSGWLCVPDTEESLEKSEQNSDGSSDDDANKLYDLHKSIMQSLEKLRATIGANEHPNRELYQTIWLLLHNSIEPWPRIGLHGGVIAWPLFIPEAYISLLKSGDWVAQILFLHHAVALRLMCNRWYVRDRGRRLVLATLEKLEDIPSEWTKTISWVKKGVGIDT